MGDMLETRDEPWLGPVRLNGAADDGGTQRVVPRTRFDSPPQLTVVNGEDAKVVPLFSGPVQRDPTGVRPAFHPGFRRIRLRRRPLSSNGLA
jgi:hypothetical protein